MKINPFSQTLLLALLLLNATTVWAIDADGDGSDAVEEALAGTSDNDPNERPYWWFTVNGDGQAARLGNSVSGAGDINSDGYADVIISDHLADNNGDSSGSARIYSGLDGSVLTILSGDNPGDIFGSVVSGAGDVNADGYSDVVIRVSGDDYYGADVGSVQVISGADSSLVYRFEGLWSSISGAGDVNGDGYGDIVVGQRGSPYNDDPGEVQVYSGLSGEVLYTFIGEEPNGSFGDDVSNAGDVNGDYYDDIIVGAPGIGDSGIARVFSGIDGQVIYTFSGEYTGDNFGESVSGAGDVDGDGYADLVIGAVTNDNNGDRSGSAYVYSGRDGALLYTFSGETTIALFGNAVSDLGDINGDGYDDVLVASANNDAAGFNAGSAHIYSGIDGSELYKFYGDSNGDKFGTSISSAGDLDGDGYEDIVVGAPWDDNNALDSGSARVILIADLMNDVDLDYIVNSADTDDDNDGMPDDWEDAYGLNPLLDDSELDADGDGYTNLQEYQQDTSPLVFTSGVKNDFTNDRIAGWIWKGVSNGVELRSRTWSADWSSASPGWVAPSRTFPPDWADQANWEIMTTGDFDGDGDADWLWRNNANRFWRVWGMEGGSRSNVTDPHPVSFDIAREWVVVGAGDTDREGDDDVIFSHTITGEVLIWEMENRVAVNDISVGYKAGYDLIRLGDFDADGDIDMLFRQQDGNILRFWEIEDNALVQEHSTQQTGAGYVTQCAGDFNNDGNADIYLLAADGTSKWFEYVDFVRQQQVFGANQAAWSLLGCGDYDGDGDMDMLWTSADGLGYNRLFINESFNNSATFYTNRYGGTNPANPGYGYEKRGNEN